MIPDIILQTAFVERPDALFRELKDNVAWDERLKARKTASFGVSYDYSGMSYPQTELPENLARVGRDIEKTLGFYPNNCLLNYYPDGESSMGYHSDSSEELAPGTGVAIISLGAERRISYRNKADKAHVVTYMLEHGALLYMDKGVQDRWMHAIPKMPGVGERISLTFRLILK
ncbi:alpha-ketoglutarate-dependent dioxygenase AlkB [Hahella sp. CR1]|uniref:alpha-ketoglutarate-dependent dioxygenase AlkB family protein n=1 Tax=Hahella sp. CR1 TaxID=2992807 RepID=UPI00244182DB|nr:alpha-ketoglutarate-dependent dioxygenase AlkB [Hahella sp. CR1]MDG9666134.1 alpha-ketoglutarate-dependent dioxygenase AlkB [Hahella sp. CR1]